MNQVYLAFIAGLTNGGISCSTVQGGLLVSSVSKSESRVKNIILFLTSKIIIHTFLGAILGYIGSSIIFSLKLQGILQILIGLFMIATAGRLLAIHPIFNFTSINLPKFLNNYILKLGNKYKIIKPIILGATTVFIPCGVTQAMTILAIGSGNPINGALIMFAFVLGTTPVFFAIGMALNSIFKHNLLTKLAGATVFILGIMSINNGQTLRGSLHTFQNYKSVILNQERNSITAPTINGEQIIKIVATNNGYQTNANNIKLNIPVKIEITSNNVVTCARSFVIPSLNINKLLPSEGTTIIEFIPTKLGLINFSCGMGMYTGSFNVVK